MKQTKQHVKDVFKHYLSANGLKSTLQRNVILDVFIDLNRHVYVDELYLILRPEHPNIGHATVYRALKLFAESGIAREIKFGDGITRYEQATETRHEHLVCTGCGAVTEFENKVIRQLQEEIVQSHGFLINTLKLELRGTCSHCLAQS